MTGNKTVNKLVCASFRAIHDNKTCSLLLYIVTMWGILTTEKRSRSLQTSHTNKS